MPMMQPPNPPRRGGFIQRMMHNTIPKLHLADIVDTDGHLAVAHVGHGGRCHEGSVTACLVVRLSFGPSARPLCLQLSRSLSLSLARVTGR